MAAALSEETAAKVCRQVEFYFSDSNLPNDNFLLKTVDESTDGLVCLRLVCSFARMRGHLGITGTGPDAVSTETAAAVGQVLKNCPSLKVSDDALRVGRATPLLKPEELRADILARSFAVSPLPWNAKREEIERFFEGITKVRSVRMPRHPTLNCSTGFSVIEFSSLEEAQRVTAMSLTYKGADLEFQPKAAFDEYMSTLAKQPRRQDKHTKGLIVKITLEKRKDNGAGNQEEKFMQIDAQAEEKKDDAKAEENKDATGGDKEKDANGEKEQGSKAEEEKANAVSREDIKAVLEQYGRVKFIDFARGNTTGYIRFETSEDADKARTAAVLAEDGGLVIKDHIAALEAVQGEAEAEYWKGIYEGQLRRKDANGSNQRRGKNKRFSKDKDKNRKGGSDNRKTETAGSDGNKHKRFDDGNEDAEPATKIQKTE